MSETLRDYLVTLGFKVNKADEVRFRDALGTAAKTVAGLSAAMAAAAATIQASVIKIAADFDSIYFASQRTGASVANIKSLTYALSQVGGSSGQASAAIEGLAAAIRTNPGIEGMLNSLGIATRENGRLKDTAVIIDGIVSSLSKSHPYYTSAQIAGILGIDEATFQVLVTQWPQIKKFQDDYRRRAAEFGVDPDKAAQNSNRLMTSFRDLLLSLQLVTEKVTVELQPVLTKYLGEFAKWVEEHSDDIVKAVLGIVEAVNGMARDFALFLEKIEPVTDAFLDLVTSLTGDSGLKWALEAVLLYMAGAWLAGMLGTLATLMRNPAFLALAAIMGIGYDAFVMSDQDKIGVGAGVNDAINGKAGDPPNWWARQQNKAREFLGLPPVDNKGNPAAPGASKPPADKENKQGGGLNPDLKSRFDKMMEDAPDHIRQSVGVNSGFRSVERQRQLFDEAVKKYGSEDAARKYVAPPGRSQHNFGEAMDLQFGSSEAREYFHQNAAKYGLSFPLPHEPWHIERSDSRNSSGKPIRAHDGVSDPDKRSEIRGISDEILKSVNQAGLQPFSSGTFALGNSVTRSASIEQNTKIEINGSSDPAGTSDKLGALQPRLNAELLRNSQSAFA
ncbi:D-alanyl-D-alanine carboxypeptidase family protein [Roseixanthobacter glucoisosaccharinicivorans]|uniref:D-alanyl-D-alanine carboxypeptidase family protein n=1 Tax=Roseixanthobacter glucoisosaccharinicivorans TaxID=3119923 RepID=UPI00372C57D2